MHATHVHENQDFKLLPSPKKKLPAARANAIRCICGMPRPLQLHSEPKQVARGGWASGHEITHAFMHEVLGFGL